MDKRINSQTVRHHFSLYADSLEETEPTQLPMDRRRGPKQQLIRGAEFKNSGT